MRTVKEELRDGYRDDAGCVGAMTAAADFSAESRDGEALLTAFANAARARNTSVAEVVALLETDGEIKQVPAWADARDLLVSDRVWLKRLTAAMNGREFNP